MREERGVLWGLGGGMRKYRLLVGCVMKVLIHDGGDLVL